MKKIVSLFLAAFLVCCLCSSCTFTVWRRIDRSLPSPNGSDVSSEPVGIPTIRCENDLFEITPDQFRLYFNQLLPSYKKELSEFVQLDLSDQYLSYFEASVDLNLSVSAYCDSQNDYIQEIHFKLNTDNAYWVTYHHYIEALIELLDPQDTDYYELSNLLGLSEEGLIEPSAVYNADSSRIYFYQYDLEYHQGRLIFTSSSLAEKEWEEQERKENGEFLSSPYEDGVYEIGMDIPAGEYVLIQNDGNKGYFEVTYDLSGSGGTFFSNGIVNNRSIVTLNKNLYVTTDRCILYPIEEAPAVEILSNILPSGMYLVGTDIPAGTYTVRPTGESMGLFSIESDSLHRPESTIDSQRFSSEITITVEDGQYITLSSAELILS